MKSKRYIALLSLVAGLVALLTALHKWRTPLHESSNEVVQASVKAHALPTLTPEQTAIVYPAAPSLRADPSEACADCHPDHVDGFKSTGMGKSLYPISDATIIEEWTVEASTVKDPNSSLVYTAYRDESGKYWQEEHLPGTTYRHRLEVELCIGSGNHTRSYLTWVDGKLIQLPLTYYVRKKKWDLSPGYDTNNLRMNRPITAKCLFCHNDLSTPTPSTVSAFEGEFAVGISCERCHGDGEAHVEYRLDGLEPKAGEADPTILNPKHLDEYRQQQMCDQCHLQGRSRRLLGDANWGHYDPRMPLEEYMRIYVVEHDGDEFEIAGHGERMQQSECYKSGKLSCTTCHNPHKKAQPAQYKTACLSCHVTGCTSKSHNKDDCATCHMPKATPSDTPHVKFTDHRIRVVQPKQTSAEDIVETLRDPHQNLRPEPDSKRRLADAVARYDDQSSEKGSGGSLAPQTLEVMLMAGLEAHPDDWDGLDALSQHYLAQSKHADAASVLEAMLALKPDDHLTALELSKSLAKNGETHRALELIDAVPKKLHYLEKYGEALTEIAHRSQGFDMTRLKPYIDHSPPNETAVIAVANEAIGEGSIRKAIKQLKNALKRDPYLLKVRFLAANLHFDLREYGQAITLLNEALIKEPTFDGARWLRARCYRKTGRLKSSRDDLALLWERQPENLPILKDYLRTLESLRESGRIRVELQKACVQYTPEVCDELKQRFSASNPQSKPQFRP